MGVGRASVAAIHYAVPSLRCASVPTHPPTIVTIKKWFDPGSNRRPPVHTWDRLLCETDVITNYTIEPWLEESIKH